MLRRLVNTRYLYGVASPIFSANVTCIWRSDLGSPCIDCQSLLGVNNIPCEFGRPCLPPSRDLGDVLAFSLLSHRERCMGGSFALLRNSKDREDQWLCQRPPIDVMRCEQKDVWSSHLYSKASRCEDVKKGRSRVGPHGYRSRRQDLRLDERLRS